MVRQTAILGIQKDVYQNAVVSTILICHIRNSYTSGGVAGDQVGNDEFRTKQQ